MVVGPLVRRGVELASDHFSKDPVEQDPEMSGAGWLVGLLALMTLFIGLVFWAVEYTYGMVVATLAAVEETNPDIYVRIDADFQPNKPIDPSEPEMASVPPKPITSKLRTTVKHLCARGGRWARFRGLSMFIAYFLARGFLTAIVPVRMDNFLGQFVAQMVSGVLLANMQLAWVHIVISEPSSKRWYQRIPGFKSWVRFAPVVVFEHAVSGAAFYFPLALAGAFGGFEVFRNSDVPPAKVITHGIAAFVIPSILSFLISVPGRAISIRVAASMLPEEDEAIVPFDRSFGGKVSPAILGGSGKLGIFDAWKTFDRAGRVRFMAVILKVFAIEFTLMMGLSVMMGAQIYLLGADTVQKLTGAMPENTA
ncbi:hypothetical protein ASPWEDRAFT_100298 [Aspergillus wentii DTO 134E9]|uniref:Uncharacterized protein n=1 Tax=Aspergillus wentii DTO 134E9 TaxID=1073089 RepID=A0A1L9RYM8_ASPWE|nr:uncharacterized protein ASPWEDRAFT_100298 [Aspergillus wentii DTO 134E9]KAI9932503.1 hypothetical protein MW887_008744 [Aspergillus wentii]OJJ40070.1 hypothetical protein ASPWEDRAFT_100298 [Aspergillus wentii DTO 134E9]